MKFVKAILWMVVCLVSIVGVLYLWYRPPRDHPIALSFLGYGPLSNGISVGVFVMSNSSKRPVVYFGNGPVNPHYFLVRSLGNLGPNVLAVTNYNLLPSIHGTQLALPPKGSITSPVPMIAGTTDLTVGVCYLPHRGPFRKTAKQIEYSLTGQWSEAYENVELKAPFE